MIENNINYADNLFVLNIKIRGIGDLLMVEADSTLFLARTCEEIEFISRLLGELLGELQENTQLVGRGELLYSFFETETRFLSMLMAMEQGRACFSFEKFPEIVEKITLIQQNSRERKNTVHELLLAKDQGSGDPRVVGSAELSELLRDF
jgi:hypothetical protein